MWQLEAMLNTYTYDEMGSDKIDKVEIDEIIEKIRTIKQNREYKSSFNNLYHSNNSYTNQYSNIRYENTNLVNTGQATQQWEEKKRSNQWRYILL